MRIEGWKLIAKYFDKHPDTIKRWFYAGELILRKNPINGKPVLYTEEFKKSERYMKMSRKYPTNAM